MQQARFAKGNNSIPSCYNRKNALSYSCFQYGIHISALAHDLMMQCPKNRTLTIFKPCAYIYYKMTYGHFYIALVPEVLDVVPCGVVHPGFRAVHQSDRDVLLQVRKAVDHRIFGPTKGRV